MVNEEIVRNTIQKMREAGLSEQIIGSTLTDLGLSPAQVQAFLAGSTSATLSRGEPTSTPSRPVYSTPSPAVSSSDLDHELLASRTSDKVVQRLQEQDALNDDAQSLKDNITHLALEQHGAQLQETHQAVVELHDKFDSSALETMSNRLTNLNARVESLSKDVSDVKALSAALQTLLQKILETNQQLLFETKNKK